MAHPRANGAATWRIALTTIVAAGLLGGCETASSKPEAKVPTASAEPPLIHGGDMVPKFITRIGDRVFFDYDKYTLSSVSRDRLVKWVAYMTEYPNVKMLIEGHTDERGTTEYNLGLGQRRADAVKDFLVAHGIEASRLRTISYGKSRPAVLGSNEKAWAENRRVVGIIQ